MQGAEQTLQPTGVDAAPRRFEHLVPPRPHRRRGGRRRGVQHACAGHAGRTEQLVVWRGLKGAQHVERVLALLLAPAPRTRGASSPATQPSGVPFACNRVPPGRQALGSPWGCALSQCPHPGPVATHRFSSSSTSSGSLPTPPPPCQVSTHRFSSSSTSSGSLPTPPPPCQVSTHRFSSSSTSSGSLPTPPPPCQVSTHRFSSSSTSSGSLPTPPPPCQVSTHRFSSSSTSSGTDRSISSVSEGAPAPAGTARRQCTCDTALRKSNTNC